MRTKQVLFCNYLKFWTELIIFGLTKMARWNDNNFNHKQRLNWICLIISLTCWRRYSNRLPRPPSPPWPVGVGTSAGVADEDEELEDAGLAIFNETVHRFSNLIFYKVLTVEKYFVQFKIFDKFVKFLLLNPAVGGKRKW